MSRLRVGWMMLSSGCKRAVCVPEREGRVIGSPEISFLPARPIATDVGLLNVLMTF